MPTFRHGKIAAFKLDDSAGVLRDLSTSLDNVDFPRTADLAETTAFGATGKSFLVGLPDNRITISGHFDATATTGPDVVLSGIIGVEQTQTFEYGPEGTPTGRVRYTGECRLVSYEIGSPVGDKVSFSAELTVDGTVTRNTWP